MDILTRRDKKHCRMKLLFQRDDDTEKYDVYKYIGLISARIILRFLRLIIVQLFDRRWRFQTLKWRKIKPKIVLLDVVIISGKID